MRAGSTSSTRCLEQRQKLVPERFNQILGPGKLESRFCLKYFDSSVFFMEHLGLKTLEEKTLESDYDKVLFLPVLPILPILTNHPNHPVSLSSICQSSSQSTWEHPMDSVYRELLSWGNPVWHSSFVFCRLEGSDGGWVSPLEDDLKGKTSYIVTVL